MLWAHSTLLEELRALTVADPSVVHFDEQSYGDLNKLALRQTGAI